jgi:hypothetical protein
MTLAFAFRALSLSSLALPLCAQTPLQSLNGAAGNLLGSAIISAGDQDGDGYEDFLVGAPGLNNGNGIVYCVPGIYLAWGFGQSTLWSVTPGTVTGTGRGFGTSLAMLGDLNGDGVSEFAVGAPGVDHVTYGTDCGATYLINGATHSEHACMFGTAVRQHFGSCMARVGDVTGDGKSELAVGGPGEYGHQQGSVIVLSGSGMVGLLNNPSLASSVAVSSATEEGGFGMSVASGFDFDGDGVTDVAVGSPYAMGQTTLTSGAIKVMHAVGATTYFAAYRTPISYEHMGWSLDGRDDYDGDGVVDLVTGAPDSPGAGNLAEGRVVVLSGYKVAHGDPSAEIFSSMTGAVGSHYGTSVRASADMNNDGVGDLFAGAPDYSTTPFGPDKGLVWILSGATGMFIGGAAGAAHDHLGDALCGAVQDYNGDGFPEYVVAGAHGDNPTLDCGVIKSYFLFPSPSSTYCTGKTNSLGCTPGMSATGTASASSAAPFLVGCFNVLNQKSGLVIYSDRPNAAPFQLGTLCVKPPTVRTAMQTSGGSTTGADCSGNFSYDFTPLIQSGSDPRLVPGAEVFCQYWSRDPGVPSSTSLSNALRFLIHP